MIHFHFLSAIKWEDEARSPCPRASPAVRFRALGLPCILLEQSSRPCTPDPFWRQTKLCSFQTQRCHTPTYRDCGVPRLSLAPLSWSEIATETTGEIITHGFLDLCKEDASKPECRKIVFTCSNFFPVWCGSPFACTHFAIPVGSFSLPTPLACSLRSRNAANPWLNKSSTHSSANKGGLGLGKGVLHRSFICQPLTNSWFHRWSFIRFAHWKRRRGLTIALQQGDYAWGNSVSWRPVLDYCNRLAF